jgi:hypothetical protein
VGDVWTVSDDERVYVLKHIVSAPGDRDVGFLLPYGQFKIKMNQFESTL